MERIRNGLEYISSSYKRAAAFLFVGALVLIIPFTMSVVSQQQDLRQQASTATRLYFAPGTVTTPMSCEPQSADLMLDPGNEVISIVDIALNYDPRLIEVTEVKSNTLEDGFGGNPATFGGGSIKFFWTHKFNTDNYTSTPKKVATIEFIPIAFGNTLLSVGTGTKVLPLGPNESSKTNILSAAIPLNINAASGICRKTPTVSPTTPIRPKPTISITN